MARRRARAKGTQTTRFHSAEAPRSQHGWWQLGLIMLVGFLAYANSLSGPFVFDDHSAVLENVNIRDWASPSVFTARRDTPTAGRPLVNLSLALNYATGGLDPRGYHEVNLVLHLFCGLMLWACIRQTLDMPRLPDPVRRWSADIATASALIWIVHPLNSEVVDYMTQRSESMMALCYFATIYASARAWSSSRPRSWNTVAVITCGLGMWCKESMVTAPVVVWLYDAVFVFGSVRIALTRRWPLYLGLATTWLLIAIVIWSGPRTHSAGFGASVSPWSYLVDQTVMITRYARLAWWPRGLVIAYGPAEPNTLAAVWPYAVFVVSLTVVVVVALVRWPLVGFVGAWIFITLAPTSSIVPIATEVGAERRMYLPLAALIVLAVTVAAQAATRLASPRAARAAFAILCFVTVGLLAAATIARNREYASPLILAETVLERWPTSFAHSIVGTQLAIAGRHDDAIAAFRFAAPGYTLARYHLGGELFNQGALDEAAAQLEEFVKREPLRDEAVPARTMIGRARMLQGHLTPAIDEFRRVLAMVPSGDEANTTVVGFLADALFQESRFGEAITEYRAFIARRPRDVGAFINLGVALAQVGKPTEADQAFRRALELDPSNATARRNLAILHEKSMRP